MAQDKVQCSYCEKEFLKDRRHVNENKKLGNNFFCSPKCLSLDRNNQKDYLCENPSCKKAFRRSPSDVSPQNFCSRACSVTITNMQRVRIKKPKEIKLKTRFLHNKETIVLRIKDFVCKNERIPVKRELWGLYHPARRFFGTWNNAVEAAGYEPNPEMFAKKQIAKDGHVCDSLAEKTIDDYLFENKIAHEIHYPYPEGNYSFDFKIGDNYLEYFGLAGEHNRYDQLMEIKKEIASRYKIDLLAIYPKDLYTKNGLEKKLSCHL